MWLDYICSCCCSSLFVGCTFDLMMLHGSLVLADLIIKVSFLWDIEFGCLEGDRGMQVKFQGYLIQKSLNRSIGILFYGSFMGGSIFILWFYFRHGIVAALFYGWQGLDPIAYTSPLNPQAWFILRMLWLVVGGVLWLGW